VINASFRDPPGSGDYNIGPIAMNKAARARDLGIPFAGTPGRWNAITDVGDVEVGMTTLIEGREVRTGVTAIHPRGRAGAALACTAGFHSFNGNGEMTGVSWIRETGTITGPICLTNTHAVGVAHQAAIRWMRGPGRVTAPWLLPVVAETWDGYLNDINGEHVTVEHVLAALDSASQGLIGEGSTGGGTGMNCYTYKAGSGTSSRLVRIGGESQAVGVFVQANFGSRRELTIAGVPVGQSLLDDDPLEEFFSGAGSIIGVCITDTPLMPNQCAAMARRMSLGVARTGTSGSHYSGDLFLALSVGAGVEPAGQELKRTSAMSYLSWRYIDTVFEACVQATEEAVINALVAGEEMTGRDGHRSPGMPVDRVLDLLRVRGAAG
jgi:D-aminopeptidase